MKHIEIVSRSGGRDLPRDGAPLVLYIQTPSHRYYSLGMFEEDNDRIVKHPGGIPLEEGEMLLHWAELGEMGE